MNENTKPNGPKVEAFDVVSAFIALNPGKQFAVPCKDGYWVYTARFEPEANMKLVTPKGEKE